MSVALLDRFSFDWFDPAVWSRQAMPVDSGGRGSAWFLDSGATHWFLRKYRRGGVPGLFIKKTYVFTGLENTRAFKELRLLNDLFQAGMPVPEPVAACVKRISGLFYQCAILLGKIENARPLDSFHRTSDGEVWSQAGRCIRLFHDSGIFHADLNCTNILVADKIYLIDFDRGYRDTGGHQNAPWKRKNLQRLRRSVDKCLAGEPASVRNSLWRHLEQGYRQ